MFNFLFKNKITKEKILEAIINDDNEYLLLNNINLCFNDKILVNNKRNKCLFNYLRNELDYIFYNKSNNESINDKYNKLLNSEIMFFNDEFINILYKHNIEYNNLESLLKINSQNEILNKIKKDIVFPHLDKNEHIIYNTDNLILLKKYLGINILIEYIMELFNVINQITNQNILNEEIKGLITTFKQNKELNFIFDENIILKTIQLLPFILLNNNSYLLYNKIINEYNGYLLIKNNFTNNETIERFKNFLPNYNSLIDIKVELFINNYGKFYYPLNKYNQLSNMFNQLQLLEESEYKNNLINKIKDELHIFDDNINILEFSLAYVYSFKDLNYDEYFNLLKYGILEESIYDCFNI